jgi:hypothetical protein
MANIIDFKSKLQGGVRPNLYQVEIPFPQNVSGNTNQLTSKTKFLCRSAAIPAATQGLIEVPFRGRFLKIPGDRTFDAWTATFYNTTDFDLRAAFENWINLGNKTDENLGTMAFGGDRFGGYFKDLTVRQLDKNIDSAGFFAGAEDPNAILRVYKLIGAWPTNVGAINLAYDSNDQIEEFDVEFQYQYLDAANAEFETGNGEFTTAF